jgi:hypothetical protein
LWLCGALPSIFFSFSSFGLCCPVWLIFVLVLVAVGPNVVG